jgi:methylmalonyl-CoA mutase N-terminal domain/subunit
MAEKKKRLSVDELSAENQELKAELERLRRERAAWLGKYGSMPKREDVLFDTLSGSEVQPLYTPFDAGAYQPDYAEKLGFPGEYPFTRGPYTTMYRTRLWTMRQFSGFGTSEETNLRYKYLLDHRHSWGTTPMIHARKVKSGSAAWRSRAWPTWRRCSTASR